MRRGALRGWRPPISAVLALGFGGLVAGAVAAVLLLALDTAERNTNELLRDTAELGIEAVVANLDHHLLPARHQVEFLAGQLGDGAVPIDDDVRLQDLLLGSLAAAPQIAGVAFVRDDLHAVRAGRPAGEYAAGVGSWIDRPEIRLAVRAARAAPGFAWGDVLYFAPFGSSFVPAQVPVRQDGRFLGVVVAIVSIGDLSGRLAGAAPSGGRSFVLRGREDVIAHPALVGGPRSLSAAKPLPRLDEVNDAVLAALWTQPFEPAGEVFADSEVTGRIVFVSGQEKDYDNAYIFLYREIESYGPAPWLVGLYFRLVEVGAPVQRLEYAAIVGGAILIGAVAVALLLGRGLARPIRRFAAAAEAIRDLSIENVAPLRGSPFRELDAAGRAFNAMLGGLRWFQTYVPRALVLQLMGQAQGELESKQRVLTVLFTDIVGFTEIGGRLEAPQLAEFLNRHFALLGACIDAEQGTIDKYIGDSIMAFWGAPALQADHAHRACRAAKAITETLQADNERRRAKALKPVRVRIGIHTGPVIVGNVGAPGRVNYTLIGDTVNTAQRLEALGKEIDTGMDDVVVLISSETADIVGDEFQLQALGAYELRGRSGSLRVHQLL